MKEALLIAAVDPGIGGVMVFGDRGTGKSTAVRALAGLLPPLTAVKGCAFHCDPVTDAGACTPDCPSRAGKSAPVTETLATPVVDLPLGATEDRIVGALDLEAALARGEKRFEPGLLARAHRGFLYIDEVNLLEDHLVDLLLDSAASGENLVEREGLSVRHPARFVLIGSGNPEEGELRPQLLDRFGLCVEVKTPGEIAVRVQIVKNRDSFERDREGFVAQWSARERQTRDAIVSARAALGDVSVDDAVIGDCARLCSAAQVDGLRGELTLVRAARALAALGGEREATRVHVKRAAPFALQHRLRRNPLDDVGSRARIERALADVLG